MGMAYKKEDKDHPEFYEPHIDEWLKARFEDQATWKSSS
jgi:hypothetical protein